MHVLYIVQYFASPRGSTGSRPYEWAQALLRAGHEVTLICGMSEASDLAADPSQRATELDVDGIRVLVVSEPYTNSMSFFRRVLAFGRYARSAEHVARSVEADIVFASSTPLTVGLPAMKTARRQRIPFVFEVRDLWPELAIAMNVIRNPLMIWYLRRMERRIYHAADKMIALAPGIRDGIADTGFPAEQVALIPNAADTHMFSPSDEPLDDPRFGEPGECRFVFAGAHGQANGLDAILDAAAALRQRQETGIRFILIGSGKEKARLAARTRAEQLDDCVTFFGRMPKQELTTLMPKMDVGLQILKNVPSFYFGTSPNKFFDYLACGIPVLTNYPGWVADLLAEHGCGLAVRPDDPSAFADAVVRLRDQPALRAEMGRKARQLGEGQFARATLAARFVAVLEEAFERRRTI